MNKKEIKIWYIIFWIAVIIMAIWIILKLLGLIKTPLLFEILPTISGFIALISLGIILGNNFQKINFTLGKMQKIETRQNRMAHGLIKVEKDTDIIMRDLKEIKKDIREIKGKM